MLPGFTGAGRGTMSEARREALSTMVERLNEPFGTTLSDADQLSFDQMVAAATAIDDRSQQPGELRPCVRRALRGHRHRPPRRRFSRSVSPYLGQEGVRAHEGLQRVAELLGRLVVLVGEGLEAGPGRWCGRRAAGLPEPTRWPAGRAGRRRARRPRRQRSPGATGPASRAAPSIAVSRPSAAGWPGPTMTVDRLRISHSSRLNLRIASLLYEQGFASRPL
jgi:hypothetical protein